MTTFRRLIRFYAEWAFNVVAILIVMTVGVGVPVLLVWLIISGLAAFIPEPTIASIICGGILFSLFAWMVVESRPNREDQQ